MARSRKSYYNADQIRQVFSFQKEPSFSEKDLVQAERQMKIPTRRKNQKSWDVTQLPEIGKRFGYLTKMPHPLVTTVFVTKGGVLKSSLVLNLARLGALQGLKVCVVGLDMQGDITSALGFDSDIHQNTSLSEALEKLERIEGLPDILFSKRNVMDLVVPTDIPNLSLIPETPELVALEQGLIHRVRREFWLKDNVIDPLKKHFDWILIDCSPNWNQLITNALVACDVLVSPIECKINNFRNLKMFQSFTADFKQDLGLHFSHIFVPTRVSPNKKLSVEILDWYQKNLPNVVKTAMKESVLGEEASAMHMSVPEYAPSSAVAREVNRLVWEIWSAHKSVRKSAQSRPSKSMSKRNRRSIDAGL